MRRLYIRIGSAHDHGIDLVVQLKDTEFEELAKQLESFQSRWEKDHKDWSFSYLIHANIQSLAEKMSRDIVNKRKKKRLNV